MPGSKYLNAKTPQQKDSWKRKICLLTEKLLDQYGRRIRLPPPLPGQAGGEYELGTIIYPAFKLVREHLKKNFFKGRMEWWNQTAIRILESLTYEGGLGPVLNTEKKTNLKEMDAMSKEEIPIGVEQKSQDTAS